MYTLSQSRRVRGSAGEPLPTVWQSLQDAGTVFRRGGFGLVAAGPGTGKSAFTLNYALRADIPALYFSADSDAFEQMSRAMCVFTGCTKAEAERAILLDELADVPWSDAPIRFSYDASPSADTLETTIEAYDEVYGEYPHLIVVDNLMNVRWEFDEKESNQDSLMNYLNEMARATGACVLALHHVTGGYNDADKPIPLSGVKNQVTAVPGLVITLFRPAPGVIGASTVKQRGGKNDPSGKTYVELDFDGETMRISDPAPSYGELGYRDDSE